MASSERVTAAVLIIGDEILSGRTQDTNLNVIARYLATYGVDLAEARVVPDIEDEIVAALNALRAALRLCDHHRRHRPDPRRHHRRLRGRGVRRAALRAPRDHRHDDGALAGRAERRAPADGAGAGGRRAW